MKTRIEINSIETDGQAVTAGTDPAIVVRNSGELYPKCVVLEIAGHTYKVSGSELKKAIDNALNV